MNIKPINRPGPHRTGALSPELKKKDIKKILGFGPNVDGEEFLGI